MKRLVKKPKRICSIYLLLIFELVLLSATVWGWYNGYQCLTGTDIPGQMRELRATAYLSGLWILTSLTAGNGSSLVKLAAGGGSGNLIRKKHFVYFFRLEKCPLCGKELELYRKGHKLMLCCQGRKDYRYSTEYEKIRELIIE